MGRYCGRQKMRTALSTNQGGLKMSGIGGFGGSKGSIRRYISRRVVSNLKPCGPIYRHGVITGFRKNRCNKRASKCTSIAGGVGRVNAPRFNCTTKSIAKKMSIEEAYDILVGYFNHGDLRIVLVGDEETLATDLGELLSKKLNDKKIIHIVKGSPEYESATKQVQLAINTINDLRLRFRINEKLPNELHVVGLMDSKDEIDLVKAGFGWLANVGSGKLITVYGNKFDDEFRKLLNEYGIPDDKKFRGDIYSIIKDPNNINIMSIIEKIISGGIEISGDLKRADNIDFFSTVLWPFLLKFQEEFPLLEKSALIKEMFKIMDALRILKVTAYYFKSGKFTYKLWQIVQAMFTLQNAPGDLKSALKSDTIDIAEIVIETVFNTLIEKITKKSASSEETEGDKIIRCIQKSVKLYYGIPSKGNYIKAFQASFVDLLHYGVTTQVFNNLIDNLFKISDVFISSLLNLLTTCGGTEISESVKEINKMIKATLALKTFAKNPSTDESEMINVLKNIFIVYTVSVKFVPTLASESAKVAASGKIQQKILTEMNVGGDAKKIINLAFNVIDSLIPTKELSEIVDITDNFIKFLDGSATIATFSEVGLSVMKIMYDLLFEHPFKFARAIFELSAVITTEATAAAAEAAKKELEKSKLIREAENLAAKIAKTKEAQFLAEKAKEAAEAIAAESKKALEIAKEEAEKLIHSKAVAAAEKVAEEAAKKMKELAQELAHSKAVKAAAAALERAERATEAEAARVAAAAAAAARAAAAAAARAAAAAARAAERAAAAARAAARAAKKAVTWVCRTFGVSC